MGNVKFLRERKLQHHTTWGFCLSVQCNDTPQVGLVLFQKRTAQMKKKRTKRLFRCITLKCIIAILSQTVILFFFQASQYAWKLSLI